jgi:hypothetical protein
MSEDQEEPTDSTNPFVHRMIPTVTAVGLTLGAGACGGSGDPGDNNSGFPSDDEIRDFCSRMQSCVGEDDFVYESMDDCTDFVDSQLTYYTNTNDPDISEGCADAFLDNANCVIDEASCNDMEEFVRQPDACDGEYATYYDACYEDDSTSM